MTFYYCFVATMGVSRTVSELDGDFSRKSQYFPTPLVFRTSAEGVALGIGYWRLESENHNDRATGTTKKFDDNFSRLDTVHRVT